MRRAIGLALAGVLSMAMPAAAHDETSVADFGEAMAATLFELEDWSAIDLVPDVEPLRAAASATAGAHLARMLAVVPMDCYQTSYMGFWIVLADLVHLTRDATAANAVAYLDTLDRDTTAATAALTGSGC